MSDALTCPIWGTPTTSENYRTDGNINVDSPRAGGKYWMDVRSEQRFKNLTDEPDKNQTDRMKARLTTWLVEQRRLGIDRPRIYEYEIDEVFWRPDRSVHARADQLLKYIQNKSAYIGAQFRFTKNDKDPVGQELFAYTESTNQHELFYLINYLVAQNWLNELSETLGNLDVEITVDGYSRIAEIEGEVTIASRAFVAMWLHESMNQAWEAGIKPGIEDSGYEAVRIDRQEHINKIDDQIIAEINRSRFIVADFTQGTDGARGGVYYEAGYAHGLGKPVVFTCRRDVLDSVHFDTRQYNHIVWEKPEELRKNLTDRIAAVIGDGPRRSDNSTA